MKIGIKPIERSSGLLTARSQVTEFCESSSRTVWYPEEKQHIGVVKEIHIYKEKKKSSLRLCTVKTDRVIFNRPCPRAP
jgi:hypothetical protein